MSKVVLAADIHYGFQGRLEHIDWACTTMVQYCVDHGIDTIVNLGDITHNRDSIGIDTYCTLHGMLTKSTELGVKWITLLGNHDMFLKHSWGINSAKPLSQVVTVIDNIKLLTLDDRRFWVLPFVHFENAYMNILRKINDMAEVGDNLLTHIGVRGAALNTCFLLKDWSFVDFEDTKFERVYTGHFHNHQQVGSKVWYPGSLVPFKFDEGGVPHGFLVYDTQTGEHEFVDIMQLGRQQVQTGELQRTALPPDFLTVLDDQLDELDANDLRSNLVRVVLSRDYSADEKSEIKDKLHDLGAKSVRWMQHNDKQVTTLTVSDDEVGDNQAELFERWVDEDKPDQLNRSLLSRLALEIRHEGDERYSYEESDE